MKAKIQLNEKLINNLPEVLLMRVADIVPKTAVGTTTWYAIVKNPQMITVQQLLSIANGLHIPVSHFFTTGRDGNLGCRSDYVSEQFIPCYYDTEVLQGYFDGHTDATWRKAAEAAGVTSDNLRKSLLAIRRTPVVRFLKVCEAFGLNPFAVLIDPNPNTGRKGKRIPGRDAAVYAEIKTLREEVANLRSVVTEYTEKLDSLLSERKTLLRQIRTYGPSADEEVGMAAEQMSEIKKKK